MVEVKRKMDSFIDHILKDKNVALELTENRMFEVYNAVKHTDIEGEVWSKLSLSYGEPFPQPIVMDLIDRKIALVAIGHTRQEHQVMWRLAELVDEALLTLAIDMYTIESFEIDSMASLLNKFSGNRWMLETLIFKKPSSLEKRSLLESAIQQNSHSVDLQRLMIVLDHAELASRSELTNEQFYFLFETNEPKVWLSLSQNVNTPEAILNKLLGVANIKNAKQIRHAARASLAKQKV
ncbi:hypothetical protein AB4Z29_01620 [Paenibacillus sp. 2TAB23]|uniref:hypothetical protein n=1 Tax=Paenibacillus sp. 2TAB23 TaxID=3233004 RepID=UPI003F9D550E